MLGQFINRFSFIAILTALFMVMAIPAGMVNAGNPFVAPLAPGHNIYFHAVGVPDNVSFTISGTRVNNGGNPTTYTTTFTTPAMSNSIGADPGSVFTYSGYPASVTAGSQLYQLVSTLPASPFIVGASGGMTVVTATYAATCISPTILVDPLDQTIVYGDPVSFTVSATGSSPLNFEWYWDGNKISAANQSTYSILSVSMSDAGLYHAVVSNTCGNASSTQAQLTVNKANQAITFDPPASTAVYGTSFVVTPTASSGLPVSLAALGSCTNSGYDVSMTSGTGTCTLIASQPGDSNYNPAGDVVRTVDAVRADQQIDFPAPVPLAEYGTTFSVTLSASSGLPVNLSSSGGCSSSGVQVTMTSGSTTCTLSASQAGDGNYNPATDVVHTVEAMKADQMISFTAPQSPVAYSASFDLQASASSGLAVSFGVSGVCSLAATTVSMTSGTGTCTITAAQAGDSNFNPASDVIHTVEAMKANQTITFTQPGTPAAYGSSFLVNAVSNAGLPVSLVSAGSCTSSGFEVTMISGTGLCVLTASQSGNANYNPAADASRTVEAAKAGQTITFDQPASPVKYQTSFTVEPVSSSYLPVAIATSGSCSSSGYTITMTKTSGACLITASQAGNLDYQPAEDVQRTVDPAPNGNIIYIPLMFGS